VQTGEYLAFMMEHKLVIGCNAGLDETAWKLLQGATTDYELIMDCNDFTEVDIALGQPDTTHILSSTRLQWMHITSAGYTRYDTDEFRAALQKHNVLFTNSSSVYDKPCAQHVMAMMLADARQLLPCYEDQRVTHAWRTRSHRQASSLLNGQTVLLLGMGAIARTLVRMLIPYDMEIIAFRKSGQLEPGIEVVGETELSIALARAHHIVNTLPESPSTLGLMNAARFGQMKAGARFYNIGRGKTVDQDALLEALQNGQVGAAYLDVTDPEPLPPTHLLWEAPNCYITPHSGGGHAGEYSRLVQHFVCNLRAFESGRSLNDLVWRD
jgi:phosphoglycerate dehydrogenase-like enzyme